MSRLPLLLFLVGVMYLPVTGQDVVNTINLYGTNYPNEKISVHFDKESYLPGETIWFKAYLFEENLPTERSTNFYAAIYDVDGKLLKQLVSPIFKGSSDGHFVIPDSTTASQLVFRAYTSWMYHSDSTMLFNQSIRVINNKATPDSREPAKSVSLQFFPEGGELIEGVLNTVAFKFSYDNGLPYLVNAVLKKQETGEVIMSLPVQHNGMGKFDMDAEPGQKYYAEWIDHNNTRQQTWLPVSKKEGVALKVSVQKDKLYYNIINRSGSDSLHVLMYMYQRVFYTSHLAVPGTEAYTGMVPIKDLPTGTMQLTVFNAAWRPVAERVAFINSNNFAANVAVQNREISLVKRGKNSLEIIIDDTIPKNMSLSISDADMNYEPAENNILSNFLLKGELRGYVHQPAFYFSNANDAQLKAKLDLVMLTNGWRRYNWAEVLENRVPAISMVPDDYLGLYGQVGTEAMEKMEKGEQVNLILKTIDSVNTFYTVTPDRSGYLKQTGLVFYDSARLYYTFNKSKPLNRQLAFSRSNFLKNQPPALAGIKNYLLPDTAGRQYNPNTALFSYYRDNDGITIFNNEKTLQGVVVKSSNRRNWQNDPLLKLEEKYVTGMFSGGANSFTMDVLHDEKAWTKFDFYNYIRGMVPGLLIGNFNLSSGRSLTYAGLPVLVYIDEHEMTTADLENLSLTQIALVKMIPNFMGRGADPGGRAMNPALSVYTRKGDDLIDRRPKETDLNMIKVAGYTPFKQFYSPDYSKNNTTGGTDARTTLLWMPYILSDKTNLRIPVTFYNNDFTSKMRLVLEGVGEDGKMIRIDRIITQ